MTRITLTVLGETQVDRTLARWADALTDSRPLWDKLANDFGAIETAQFAGEGPFSGGWAPLSPRYAAWKERKYPGAPILTATGALARSLTQRPFGVERITGDSLTVGTTIPYAWHHQHGVPSQNLPQRRPVEFTELHRRRWANTIQRYVVEATRS